jgi:hypothetical protein
MLNTAFKKSLPAILLFGVLSLLSTAQDFPDAMYNTKTAKHINIQQTKLFIVPPDGFIQKEGIIGIMSPDDKSGITVIDAPGADYRTASVTFTKEAMEAKGLKVILSKQITFNGYPAKLMIVYGSANSTNYELMFGDTSFINLVMATFPTDDTLMGEKIENAFKTLAFDKTLKLNPLAAIPFTLDYAKQGFHVKNALNNTLLLVNSKDSLSTDTLIPSVTSWFTPLTSNIDVKTLAVNTLTKLEESGFDIRESKNEETKVINGYNAYEAELYGTLRGKQAMAYFLSIGTNEKAVIYVGVAFSDFVNNLNRFKKLAYTVSFKKGDKK